MKPFTLVWDELAIDELAEIWESAKDRRAITRASAQIDGLLKATGQQAGIEIQEGLRSLTVLPLRVIFTASAEDCLVTVYRVRLLA
ncbi:MAG: hypothetical protein SH850_26390 [Planctomycetaceae bacterium]|nr:hypothetical protein [Planctomycetaceae bacterium]